MKRRNEHIIRLGFNSFWDGNFFQDDPAKAKIFRDGQKARRLIKRWFYSRYSLAQAILYSDFKKMHNLN